MIINFDHLKHVFNKSDFSGCLAKWVMLLMEFDLKFVLQKAIKGRALTNQLAESPSLRALRNDDSFPDESILKTKTKPWDIYFDRSKCRIGSGAGVIIILLGGKPIPLSYHMNFLYMSNTTEYEALLARLHVTLSMRAQDVKIFSDSQLIIKQINGTY